MGFEIDDLLKEINRFKSNVTSSSDLVDKLEEAINNIKSTSKDSVKNIEEHLKTAKESIDNFSEETKNSIISAKDTLVDAKEKFVNTTNQIAEVCETIVNNSKETTAKVITAIQDIDATVEKYEKKAKRDKLLVTIGFISLGIINIATLIISIICLTK